MVRVYVCAAFMILAADCNVRDETLNVVMLITSENSNDIIMPGLSGGASYLNATSLGGDTSLNTLEACTALSGDISVNIIPAPSVKANEVIVMYVSSVPVAIVEFSFKATSSSSAKSITTCRFI